MMWITSWFSTLPVKQERATKLLGGFYGPYRVIRKISPVDYEIQSFGKKRKDVFIIYVSKMKLFRDRNELYVDSEGEDGESWIPVARLKDDDSGNRHYERTARCCC